MSNSDRSRSPAVDRAALNVDMTQTHSVSCAERYMEDAQEFYNAYKSRGGKCRFNNFKELLRAFFEHTLNSHVFGLCEKSSQKDEEGFWLHPSPDAAEMAWVEETGKSMQEFSLVFYAVDSVHAYT